jgi:hypothetical protein
MQTYRLVGKLPTILFKNPEVRRRDYSQLIFSVKIFIENQYLTIGPPKITLLFLGTSAPFNLPLHSFEKRPNGPQNKG